MSSSITKDEIADILEEMGQLLELKGENLFKVRAYQNAARAVETFAGNLAQVAAAQELTEIPGIGTSMAEKIEELFATGKLVAYEELKAEFPPGLFELFGLPGLGAKKIRALYEKLNIASLAELEAACKDDQVATLTGFGAKTAANLLAAIEERQSVVGTFTLGDASLVAETLYESLRELPEVSQISIAGSYRRRKEIVHDLDFLAATKEPEVVMEAFTRHPLVKRILAKGATKSSVLLTNGLQADLRAVSNEQYPFALSYFTGSKEHNIVMRSRALARGWTLNEYRLGPVEGSDSAPPPPIHDEHDLYRTLDLDYVEPELRENLGEIAAAEKHKLPRLVELSHLRGTFHNHTTASDGRNTLEEMAAAAQELGLQYLGIADHSKSSFQAHGLDEKSLLKQVEEIAALNKEYDGFHLFAGSEVDILKNGKLDFSDEILSQLDYCVASVHASFTLSEAEMTKRIIKAISNPYVTMLGHLTGRLLLTRKPYAVDVPAIIEAAAETGTIIEINANPMRLDMDWRWWPLAKEKGVKCAINPDAHQTAMLQNLWFGVAIARKGWLTRDDVINCLPLSKIKAALRAKRKAI